MIKIMKASIPYDDNEHLLYRTYEKKGGDK